MHLRKRDFLKSGAAIGAASVAGCLGSITGGEMPTLRMNYTVPAENLISLMAIPEIQSEFENLGSAYELETNQNQSTPDSLNAMASGEADMALLAYASFPAAVSQDAVPGGITAIAMDFYDAHEDYFRFPVMSMADSDVTDAEDLEGRTIAVNALGTGVHAIIYRMLENVGIDPENGVEFVELPFPSIASAIREGRVDAGIFVALFAAAVEAEGDMQTVFDSRDSWGQAYPFGFVAASNDSLDGKEEAIRAWASDYVSMVERVYENREETARLAAEHFDLPEALLSSYYLTERDYYRPRDVGLDIEALQFVTDELADMGFLEASPTISDHATNEYTP
ncbi:ABC transporter substrate-binding protein [Halobellus captivus]|uniref:ABC transporter substrate-binding protein n=1 Tax=Halobellus captivus TaxID=2592614 RepID=UPI0011A218F2|nr:ABC transporter substrate-binding protein [Halobellus captivus]